MEPLYSTGEEGIHSCFALRLLVNEWSNVSNALLCRFMTLMENVLVFCVPAGNSLYAFMVLIFARLWIIVGSGVNFGVY